MMPKPPNVEMTREPIEEQLAQVLEAIPKIEPEKNDLSDFNSGISNYTYIHGNQYPH
ncbi:MAG: hypothetical protein M3044_11065 [Thermoproteota archaeon]|nr:hypothetical protein [Thermoproteota archaeon]